MGLKRAKDNEAQKHELFCWLHDIDVKARTMFSCNCSEKEAYQKRVQQKYSSNQQH